MGADVNHGKKADYRHGEEVISPIVHAA